MLTRAINLVLVSNLSSEAFLAALHRSMSRQGMCFHIFNDNGTNFVGVDKELSKLASLQLQANQ